jgi:hypothetical protein
VPDKPYASIVAAWEECLKRHRDSAPGVGWPRNDADLRYRVMPDLLRSVSDVTLLDFGCGASHFYELIQRRGLNGIRYSGIDVSLLFLEFTIYVYFDPTIGAATAKRLVDRAAGA